MRELASIFLPPFHAVFAAGSTYQAACYNTLYVCMLEETLSKLTQD